MDKMDQTKIVKIKEEMINGVDDVLTRQISYRVDYDDRAKRFVFMIPITDAMANDNLDFEKLAFEAINYYVETNRILISDEFYLPFRSNGGGFIVY